MNFSLLTLLVRANHDHSRTYMHDRTNNFDLFWSSYNLDTIQISFPKHYVLKTIYFAAKAYALLNLDFSSLINQIGKVQQNIISFIPENNIFDSLKLSFEKLNASNEDDTFTCPLQPMLVQVMAMSLCLILPLIIRTVAPSLIPYWT